MSQIPTSVHPHLDTIQHHSGGGVFLGASNLTGRNWTGSLWYFASASESVVPKPDWYKCTAGAELETGVSDLKILKNNTAVLALDSGAVEWWRLQEQEHTFSLTAGPVEHDDIVSSVDLNANQSKTVSGSHDSRVIVWDAEECISLHSYRGHASMIHCVACHPSEPDVFLSCSQDGDVLMWDLRKPKPARHIDISCMASVPTSVAWQPDKDNSFAVGSESGDICLFDERTVSAAVSSVNAHTRSVHRLVFNPKKPSWLASVSEDCTTAISQFSTEEASISYRDSRHTDFTRGASWSPVTGQLYSCGWDFQVLEHSIAKDTSNGHVAMNGQD